MLTRQELKTYKVDKQCDKCKKGSLVAMNKETYNSGSTIKLIHHECNNCGEEVIIKGQKFPKLMHKAEGEITEIPEEDLNFKVEYYEPEKKEKKVKVEPEAGDSISLD